VELGDLCLSQRSNLAARFKLGHKQTLVSVDVANASDYTLVKECCFNASTLASFERGRKNFQSKLTL
jgi:hypothetical protein